jgi:hypothetical protein
MEMTCQYMNETAQAFRHAGFRLQEAEVHYGSDGHVGRQFRLSRGLHVSLVLEALETNHAGAQFYLSIVQYHGLSSPSFPLDSWKHHPDRVEFKYLADPSTGQGLTFVVPLAHKPST